MAAFKRQACRESTTGDGLGAADPLRVGDQIVMT
jgi:hypothetical protein